MGDFLDFGWDAFGVVLCFVAAWLRGEVVIGTTFGVYTYHEYWTSGYLVTEIDTTQNDLGH